MIELGSAAVLSTFVLFCRIGGCLMLMPGFSSPRVPVNVRLFIAIGVTLALAPLLLPEASRAVPDGSFVSLVPVMISELVIGTMIGLLGRLFFLALQTLATAVAMSIGFGNMFGAPVEDTEPSAPLVSLVTLTATVLVFVTDQHWQIFSGLAASYEALPISAGFGVRFGLSQVADSLTEAFFLALRVSSPFIVYSVIVNLAIGLANKLTPQIPVYFISLPFVIAGGLFLLYFAVKEFVGLFILGFGSFLATG